MATNTNTNTNIAERVGKLLAKAEDAAATPEEAQTFAAKAAELIGKYNLDAATLRHKEGKRPEPIKLLEFKVSGQGHHGKGRATLICTVAAAYGCQVCTLNNKLTGEDRWVMIVGPAATIKALEILLPSILRQAESNGMKATREHMKALAGGFDTPANANIERRKFFRSYLPGYGQGVADKIAASRRDMAAKVAGKPGELVLVSDAERTKAAFEKRFPDLRKGRADQHSAEGADAGRRDGRNADTGQTKVGGDKRAVTSK